MREDDPGQRRVEGGGNGGCDPAADADVPHPAPALVDIRDRGAQGCSQVSKRPVLSRRRAGSQGDDAGCGREQAGAGGDVPFEALYRPHDVGRGVRPAFRNELVKGAHDKSGDSGYEDRNEDEENGVLHLPSRRRRDEEQVVEQGHHVDEEHRGERCNRADRKPQDCDGNDRAGEAG